MTLVRDALSEVTRLGIDTPPMIYLIEANPRYESAVRTIFEQITRGSLTGLTSVITLGEVLVQPYTRQDQRLQERYREILLRSHNFLMLPVDAAAADRAASLRAQYNLRLPDALQLAVALNAGCEAFLTNDRGLQRVTDLRVLTLDNLEP